MLYRTTIDIWWKSHRGFHLCGVARMWPMKFLVLDFPISKNFRWQHVSSRLSSCGTSYYQSVSSPAFRTVMKKRPHASTTSRIWPAWTPSLRFPLFDSLSSMAPFPHHRYTLAQSHILHLVSHQTHLVSIAIESSWFPSSPLYWAYWRTYPDIIHLLAL